QNRSRSELEVKTQILNTTTPTSSLNGKTITGGRLNAAAALGNTPPTLAPIPDKTIPSTQQVLTVTLSGSDPDGDPLTYSATAQSLAYVLNQQYGFFTDGNFFQNYGGQNEKWVQGGGSRWFFVLPGGQLYLWDGTPNQATGTLLGNVGSAFWTDPNRLINPPANQ